MQVWSEKKSKIKASYNHHKARHRVVFSILSLVLCLSGSSYGQGEIKWDDRFDSQGMNDKVYAVSVYGSDVYAGGAFTYAAGTPANFVAKWDGTNWSALNSGLDNRVWALAADKKDVYAGGEFTAAGGSPANHIARWDGKKWFPLTGGVNGKVNAIALDGTDVYVGGEFVVADGIPVNYIAKWDGSQWSALGNGLDGMVHDIVVQGSDIYVAGEFTTAGSVGANYIARWNGSSWSPLGTGLDKPAYSLAARGNEIYAGGEFLTAGAAIANYIARWDGSAWSALGSGVNGKVLALTASDQIVYAAGEFTAAGGNSADFIAKWFKDEWSNLGSGLDSKGLALTYAADEQAVYTGGEFNRTGIYRADFFGRWIESLQLIWTGTVNSNWHIAGNWTPNSVPTETDHVTVEAALYNPAITMNAHCWNLTVEKGGFLLINNGWDLTVNGNLALGKDAVKSDDILTLTGAASIHLKGNYVKRDKSRINSNGSTIYFTGRGDQSVTSGGIGTEDAFNNVVIDKPDGSLFLTEQLLVKSNFLIRNGVFNAQSYDLYVGRNWENSDTFAAGTGTVIFNAASAGPFSILTNNDSFYHLTFNTAGTYQTGSVLDINGNFTLTAGTLDMNGLDLSVSGNFTNNGQFYPGSGNVHFVGSGNQDFSGAGSGSGKALSDVVIDKSGGAVQLLTAMDIDGDLTISNGEFDFNNQDIFIGGNFINRAAISNPNTVTLDATAGGSYSIENGGAALHHLVVQAPGILYQFAGNCSLTGNLKVSSGTLDLNGFQLSVGDMFPDTVFVSGTLEIDAGSDLSIVDSGRVIAENGGTVVCVGTSDNLATITAQAGAGSYEFIVENGAAIQARYARFEYMAATGIEIRDGASIDPLNNFSYVEFDHGQPGGTMLAVGDISGIGQKLYIQSAGFLTNPGSGATNVSKSSSSDTLRFVQAYGFFAGESYEDDPFHLVEWESAVITKIWTGAVNNLWSTSGNWNPAGVPVAADNVIIPGDVPRDPVISNDAGCNDLLIEKGGFLQLSTGRTLDADGNIDVGSSDLPNDGILTLNSGSSLRVGGDYTKKDQSTLNANNATVYFDGSGDQNLYSGGNQSGDAFHHLIIDKSSGGVILADSLLIEGNFVLNAGTFTPGQYNIAVAGHWMNSGNYLTGSGRVTFNASAGGPFTVQHDGASFPGVVINSTQVYRLGSQLDIDGHFTLVSGTLNANSYDIQVAGNWQNGGLFDPGSGTVNFDGSLDQTISGTAAANFNHVVVNKSSGMLQAAISLNIDGNLMVTAGTFHLDGQQLQFGDAAGDGIEISGALIVNDFSELQMTGGTYIRVNSGGELKVLGNNPLDGPVLTRLGSGHYTIDVVNGGSIEVKNTTIEYTAGNGIHVQDGATIANGSNFENTTFQNGTGTAYLTVANDQHLTLQNVKFDSAGSSRASYNVVYSGTGELAFSDYTGSMSGANFENDNGSAPRGYVRWYFTESHDLNNQTQIFGNDARLSTADNLRAVTVCLVDNILSQAPASVARYYTLQSERSGAAVLRLYYSHSELQGEVESDLIIWMRRNGSWTKLGGTVNTAQNFVELASGYLPAAGVLDTLILSDAQDDLALPVELTVFSGSWQQEKIVLEWQTASEIENVGFIVLRAEQQEGNYQLISSYEFNEDLKGQFNSSAPHRYLFIDGNVKRDKIYWYKLLDVDVHGIHTEHSPIEVSPAVAVIPEQFRLYPGYPNPFNPATTLRFDIPGGRSGQVEVNLTIYNGLGQKVSTIFRGYLNPGTYQFQWTGQNGNGEQVAAGVYLAVLITDANRHIQKLILSK